MLDASIEMLAVKKDGVYVDGTLGRGGHSLAILKRLDRGKLFVFDLDQTAIDEAKERLASFENVTYIHDNFANIDRYFKDGAIDGIILDLGVSSPQFDEAERGFSYRFDARLDMRMNQDSEHDAYQVVNNYSKEDLIRILRDYGEERFAKAIAEAITNRRAVDPITTTWELVEVIKSALPAKELSKKGHPAKKTFQAIRIEVNQELASLQKFLTVFDKLLKVDGRVAVISFHSLEDKMVKTRFRELSWIKTDKRIALLPSEIETPRYETIGHKAIVASETELAVNHRSKSAKLRGIKKVRD